MRDRVRAMRSKWSDGLIPAFHFSNCITFSIRAATKAVLACPPSARRMARAGIRIPPRIARLD